MKKNRMMRAASALLVAVLLTTCTISGTFAKYVSDATVTDTARVAQWSIKVDGKDIVKGETVTFDLFDTVKEVDAATVDADVASKNTDNVIAPGTGGQFKFAIKNDSEVNATYTITLAEAKSSNIPIEYSLDGTTWYSTITDLNNQPALTNVAINMNTAAADSATVYWRWAFVGAESSNYTSWTDAMDTALGSAGTATLQILATITATQVN